MDELPQHLTDMFSSGRPAEGFVGLNEQVARDRANAVGVDRVRVFRVGTNLSGHADHRPSRLNLVVREGRVILASYF